MEGCGEDMKPRALIRSRPEVALDPFAPPKGSMLTATLPPVARITPASFGDLFTEFDRRRWAELGSDLPPLISGEELGEVCTLNEVIDLREVAEVYVPICNLLGSHRAPGSRRGPCVIGIGGSVAAGKSTTARLLQTLLSRCWPECKVALVPTDGFLHPNRD